MTRDEIEATVVEAVSDAVSRAEARDEIVALAASAVADALSARLAPPDDVAGLVERLRQRCSCESESRECGAYEVCGDDFAAADALTALSARAREAEARAERLRALVKSECFFAAECRCDGAAMIDGRSCQCERKINAALRDDREEEA